MNWTRDQVRQACGGRQILDACDAQHQVTAAPASGADDMWAGLEAIDEQELRGKTVSDVLDMQDRAEQGQGRQLYIHDASIDRPSYLPPRSSCFRSERESAAAARLCPELLIDGAVKVFAMQSLFEFSCIEGEKREAYVLPPAVLSLCRLPSIFPKILPNSFPYHTSEPTQGAPATRTPTGPAATLTASPPSSWPGPTPGAGCTSTRNALGFTWWCSRE